MECREDLIEGDMDKFVSVMKSNTVVECKIIKLKSYINSLRNELNNLNRKIKMEKSVNCNLSKEIDVNQSMELQIRTRIGNLNESKQFTAKMCNDLYEQVNLEKQRSETLKVTHDSSIKNQLAKWEEYQILYKKFPLAKEVESVNVELKRLAIEKKKAEYELKNLVKKIEIRDELHERRLQIAKEKLEESEIRNESLKKKKELLENNKEEQLQLIENLRRQKNEIQSKILAENGSINNMKRPADIYETNLTADSTRRNSDFKAESQVVDIELPELPQLQLLQTSIPSRKIRRIDMIDTTLQRPSYLNLMKSKPARLHSASTVGNVMIKKTRTLSTISSRQIEINAVIENPSNSLHDSLSNCQSIRPINLTQLYNEDNQEVRQVDNQTVKLSAVNNFQSISENENGSLEPNVDVEEDNERIDSTYVQESNEDLNGNETEENIEEENVPVPISSCGKQRNENTMDDGYYSQSQNTATSQMSQLSKIGSNNSKDGRSTISVQQFEHLEGRAQQNLSLEGQRSEVSVPSTVTSVSSNVSERCGLKYFTSERHDVSLPTSVASTSNAGNVFKAPPPRSLNTSLPLNRNADNFYSTKDQQPKPNNYRVMSSQQKPIDTVSVQSSYFTSTGNDNVISSWAKSPSPPRDNNVISPPDTPFNSSYLNLLSPPQNHHSISVNNESDNAAQTSADSSNVMNMFGPSQTPTASNSGFSFTSKMPSTSFFSMFK